MKNFMILFTLAFALISIETGTMNATSKVSSEVSTEAARAPSSEGEKQATCRFITGDVGTIVGKGSSKRAAFEDAANQCFDRRVKMFEQVTRATVDMDRGQDFIDACVNTACS